MKMNGKSIRVVWGFKFILIVCLGIAATASAQETSQWANALIEGTWRTNVTPINCQTGTPVAPAFPGILTFSQGGTLSGTSATVSSAYGVWSKGHGRRLYTFAFTNLRYDASGVLVGSQVVRQTASMSGNDQFTSSGTVQFFDLAGNLVGNGCAASTGARFE